jgi:hypothetical protein
VKRAHSLKVDAITVTQSDFAGSTKQGNKGAKTMRTVSSIGPTSLDLTCFSLQHPNNLFCLSNADPRSWKAGSTDEGRKFLSENFNVQKFLSENFIFVRMFLSEYFLSESRHCRKHSKVASIDQGCQIFLGTIYQHGENVPNYHKIYLMAIKYIKRP